VNAGLDRLGRFAPIPGTQLTSATQIRTLSAPDEQSTVQTVCVRLRSL